MNPTSSRTPRLLSVCLLPLLLLASAAQAQLTPPPGPVSPSMKRLDQIEPRICVNTLPGSQTAVHVISQPGNYYLTADVRGEPRKHGIEITCDGHVSLDFNGFSLIGVPQSLNGIFHGGGSGNPDTRRAFTISHVLEKTGRINGFTGDGLNLNNLDSCDIRGLVIEDCGGLAIRISSHDTCKNSIQNVRLSSCGGGGVGVTCSSGGGGGRIDLHTIDVSSCGGDGIHISCPSDSSFAIKAEKGSVNFCNGHGICRTALSGGGGGGSGGSIRISDFGMSRLTGNGIHCVCTPGWRGPDCIIERVTIADTDGDGVHMLDCPVSFNDLFCSSCGGNALTVEGSSSPVSRCVGTNFTFDTTLFACTITNVMDVSLSSGRCVNCKQDGFSLSSVALASISSCDATSCGGNGYSCRQVSRFKAGVELSPGRGSRIVACAGNGAYFEDCPDVQTRGLDISSCLEFGILHVFSSPPQAASLSHEAAHVVQQREGGARIHCPSSVSLDVSISSSSFLNNDGPGVSISCPTASSVRCVLDRCVCTNNGSSGVELVCHADSSVQCVCTHLRCVNNGGDGVACVCPDPASSLSSSSLRMESCVCSSNSGNGCLARCPLEGTRCVFSSNGVSGCDVAVPSPFDSGGTLSDCVLHHNALQGARCGPGRFANARCDASDNGGNGFMCVMGCLILDSCVSNRNGGDGAHAVGTLTISGGAMRRNGGAGVRCADGSCTIADCVSELNGTNPGVTGGGIILDNCSPVALRRCVCSSNTGPGVRGTSSSGSPCVVSAIECVCSDNSLDGMSLSHCAGAQVLRCTFSSNLNAWGLECVAPFVRGKIEGCSCTGNAGGILVEGTGSIVVSNSCSAGPLGSISAAQGNTVGRLLDQGAIMSGACDPHGNIIH